MNYIIAVSGGVDSVVLLDQLMTKKVAQYENDSFIVAHFEHGVREDSPQDAAFVRQLAEEYAVPFELGSARLGAKVSEAVARKARYEFLRAVQEKRGADAILTAHHQDDVIETAIINIIRGTGWRGLISLDSNGSIKRPLLDTSKKELLAYAKKHTLQWREDSTNSDERYLRNHVRRKLIPLAGEKDGQFKATFLKNIADAKIHKEQINKEVGVFLANSAQITKNQINLQRYELIMVPSTVAREVVHQILRQLDMHWHPTRRHIQRALHFIKTAQPGATLHISKQLHIVMRKEVVQFKKV